MTDENVGKVWPQLGMESSLEFKIHVLIEKMQNKLINIVETWIINAWII